MKVFHINTILVIVSNIITFCNNVSTHTLNNNNHNVRINNYVQDGEKRVEILNPRYQLEWSADLEAKTIQFTVTALATGYIGFGLSNLGSMIDADIVIAGVYDVNNTIYFGDYHGVGFTTPVLDDIQNWELVDGSQINGNTSITFKRDLDTCDFEHDLAITNGTIKIIWSLGESDDIVQHPATSRGVLSMNLLDPAPPAINLTEYDHFDIEINYNLTEDDTVYWCTVHRRDSSNKSHIIAFNPILPNEDAARHTHHYNMFVCQGDNLEEQLQPFVDAGGVNCLKPVPGYTPRELCQMNLYARSLGGRTLIFPENVGYPWGSEGNTAEYFLFETHFDNPKKVVGLPISTGVEIYHTTDLREHEAGMLWMGHTNGASIMIPPSTADWTLAGHCTSNCLTKSITNSDDGTELPWVSNDETYDFDYQENRPLIENRQVLPNDHLTLECTYDSNWYSPNAVVGGLSTRDEMCMAFLYYYPKTDFGRCFSGYPRNQLLNSFGIEEFTTENGNIDPLIIKPDKWANLHYSDVLTYHTTWTEPMKLALMNELRFGVQTEDCATLTEIKLTNRLGRSHINKLVRAEGPTTTYPEFDQEYVEEKAECLLSSEPSSSTETNTTPSSSNQLAAQKGYPFFGPTILVLFVKLVC